MFFEKVNMLKQFNKTSTTNMNAFKKSPAHFFQSSFRQGNLNTLAENHECQRYNYNKAYFNPPLGGENVKMYYKALLPLCSFAPAPLSPYFAHSTPFSFTNLLGEELHHCPKCIQFSPWKHFHNRVFVSRRM